MSGALLAASISDPGRNFALYRIGLVVAVLSTGAMGMMEDVYPRSLLRFVSGFSSTAGLLLASGLVLIGSVRDAPAIVGDMTNAISANGR